MYRDFTEVKKVEIAFILIKAWYKMWQKSWRKKSWKCSVRKIPHKFFNWPILNSESSIDLLRFYSKMNKIVYFTVKKKFISVFTTKWLRYRATSVEEKEQSGSRSVTNFNGSGSGKPTSDGSQRIRSGTLLSKGETIRRLLKLLLTRK
jgi:hypothetical protein